jgi:hypothetical protein
MSAEGADERESRCVGPGNRCGRAPPYAVHPDAGLRVVEDVRLRAWQGALPELDQAKAPVPL